MSDITFSNRIVRPKKHSYDYWWNAPVESTSNQWETEQYRITHGDYVKDFYYKLKNAIQSKGYDIIDEKEFKSEIATLIYKLSDDHQ